MSSRSSIIRQKVSERVGIATVTKDEDYERFKSNLGKLSTMCMDMRAKCAKFSLDMKMLMSSGYTLADDFKVFYER
jgi:hypothetical protein